MYSWNDAAWGALQSRPNGLPGTLLLAGPVGVGKRSFAQTLAQGSLCANRAADGKPCGACASCRLFVSGSHPDFRLLEPAATEEASGDGPDAIGGTSPAPRASRAIVISQIRDLGDFLAVTSHLGGAKVVLIQPADRLHPSAANALLKTLEEPRPGTRFILVSDRPQRLSPQPFAAAVFASISRLPQAQALHAMVEGQGNPGSRDRSRAGRICTPGCGRTGAKRVLGPTACTKRAAGFARDGFRRAGG